VRRTWFKIHPVIRARIVVFDAQVRRTWTFPSDAILFDAGLFIGALLRGDPRPAKAYPLVKAARRGELAACTTVGILSEVYAERGDK